MLDRIRKLSIARVRQELSSNPLAREYYTSAELRTMGFRQVGDNVRLERSVKVVNPAYIRIGDNVTIDQFTVMVAGAAGIDIGSHLHIAGHVLLGGNAGITLKDFANIAVGSRLISATDDFSGDYLMGPAIPAKFCNITAERIILEEHTILGASTIVLPGVVCAEGTATGAQSLLTSSTEPWWLYTGSPAKKRRSRSRRALELAQQFLSEREKGA